MTVIKFLLFNELPRGRASRYQLKDFFNSEAEPRGINRQPNNSFFQLKTLENNYHTQIGFVLKL